MARMTYGHVVAGVPSTARSRTGRRVHCHWINLAGSQSTKGRSRARTLEPTRNWRLCESGLGKCPPNRHKALWTLRHVTLAVSPPPEVPLDEARDRKDLPGEPSDNLVRNLTADDTWQPARLLQDRCDLASIALVLPQARPNWARIEAPSCGLRPGIQPELRSVLPPVIAVILRRIGDKPEVHVRVVGNGVGLRG